MTPTRKRFYRQVELLADEHQHWQVILDGKPISLDGEGRLCHLSKPLMDKVAHEWEVQKEFILLDTMPFTNLTLSLNRMDAAAAQALREEILHYALNDTLCYHAPAGSELESRQAEDWGKWIRYISNLLKAECVITHGIMPISQPQAWREAVMRYLEKLDAPALLSLYVITGTLVSFILASAVLESALETNEAVRLSWLEQDSQIEQWGEDDEHKRKREHCLSYTNTILKFYSIVTSHK